MNKTIFRVLVNTCLGLVLIFVWSRFVNISLILDSLKSAKWQITAIFFIFFITSTLFRALRLKILLGRFNLPVKDLLMLNFLSQFLSFMIPLRLGELTKSIYLNSRFDLPLVKSVVWIFVDRFFDFWVVFLVASMVLAVDPMLPQSLIQLIWLVFFGVSLFVALSLGLTNLFKKILKRIFSFIPQSKLAEKLTFFTHSIIDGFEILKSGPLRFVSLILLSIMATLSDAAIWWVSFKAVNFEINPVRLLLGDVLSALTFLIPAAPGYVGSAEASILAVFSGLLGVDPNISSSAAVLFHILTLIALPVFGILSLYFLKFDLNLVWKKLKRE